MALPTYQATGAIGSGATTATCTVAWPTHQVGDLAILVAVRTLGTYGTLPALNTANGFRFLGQIYSGSGGGVAASVFWCLATSSSMASPIVDGNLGGSGTRGIIFTYRGCDLRVPCSPLQATVGGSANTNLVIASGNSNTKYVYAPNALIACIITSSATYTLSAEAATNLSSVTERTDTSGSGGSFQLVDGVPADASLGPMTGTLSTATTVAMLPMLIHGSHQTPPGATPHFIRP